MVILFWCFCLLLGGNVRWQVHAVHAQCNSAQNMPKHHIARTEYDQELHKHTENMPMSSINMQRICQSVCLCYSCAKIVESSHTEPLTKEGRNTQLCSIAKVYAPVTVYRT